MYEEMHTIIKPDGKLLTAVFGKRTDGFGTGKKLEEDTYSNLKCGTLKGRTKIHFLMLTVCQNCWMSVDLEMLK